MKNLVTGVIAGIIVFIWVMASWMFLPWHTPTFSKFSDEAIVVKELKNIAPESGVYIYPGMDVEPEKAMGEPHIFASVRHEPKDFKFCMMYGLLIHILAGLVITCLASKANAGTFPKKFMIVFKASLFAAILANLPNWNWWSLPLDYTLIGMADILIGWSIAGLWIAKRV
jgi:hypothetical protein